jgi:hypothetical protein
MGIEYSVLMLVVALLRNTLNMGRLVGAALEWVSFGAIKHSMLSFFSPATPLDTMLPSQQALVAFVSFVLYLNRIENLDEGSITNGVNSNSFFGSPAIDEDIAVRLISTYRLVL